MKRYISYFLGALLLMLGVDAFAAVPAVVGTTITGIQTDALSTMDLIFPVVGAILGVFVVLKIFKRGVNKI